MGNQVQLPVSQQIYTGNTAQMGGQLSMQSQVSGLQPPPQQQQQIVSSQNTLTNNIFQVK